MEKNRGSGANERESCQERWIVGDSSTALASSITRSSSTTPHSAQNDSSAQDDAKASFWREVEHCQSTVLEGLGNVIRWGVPDGTRDEATGDMVHDDLLVSAAMCWVLDGLGWGLAESEVIRGFDPVEGMRGVF